MQSTKTVEKSKDNILVSKSVVPVTVPRQRGQFPANRLYVQGINVNTTKVSALFSEGKKIGNHIPKESHVPHYVC